ncbi:beta-barrel fold lipoprotein, partial [Parabacteroides distasonis]
SLKILASYQKRAICLLWKQINLGLLMATAIAMILIAEKISRKKNIRACLLYIHMDLNLKYIKMMKKIKLHLFALCATLVLVSCGGSDDDPVFNNTSAVYKVVLEASGDDYTAEAIIINPDNVSIIDETSNTDLKQSSVTEYFSGRKVYITSKEVKVISAQGIILSKSKSGAILKMTVYQDGKEVYQNTVSVPDSENNTKSIQYTNIKN